MQGKKSTQRDKKKFLEALKRRHGIVTLACKDVSISSMTFYRWQKSDAVFYQESEEVRDIEIGIIAEDRLAEAIIVNKDMAMVRFYLQSRSARYTPKLQTEMVDPTHELAKLLSLDADEDKSK
jgi:hypothetical protein